MKSILPFISKKSVLGFSSALLALGLLSPSVQAASMVFFGEDLNTGNSARLTSRPNADAARNNFFSNLSGVGTEDFEGIAAGTSTPFSINFAGAGTATLSGNGSIRNVPTGNFFGRYPTSGNQYLRSTSGSLAIDFSNPIAAFGFYGTDLGDFNGQIQLEFSNGTSEVVSVPTTAGAPNGSVSYFGYIADAGNEFVRATFSNTGSSTDVFGFDDFTIGSRQQVVTPPPTAVPEPGTISALIGMAAIGGLSLGKRKRNEPAA